MTEAIKSVIVLIGNEDNPKVFPRSYYRVHVKKFQRRIILEVLLTTVSQTSKD